MKRIFYFMVVAILISSLGGCNKEQGDSVPNIQTEVSDTQNQQAAEAEELRQQIAKLETQIAELEQQIEVLETQIAEMETVENTVTLVNPIREVTREEILTEVGIPLNVPKDATNVVYHVITGENTIAQAKFNINGLEYCLRACATSELEPVDISGLYYNWEVQEEAEVGYCTGKVFLTGGVGYIAWLDIVPGINYNLSLTEGATKEALVEMAESVFVEVQGDS